MDSIIPAMQAGYTNIVGYLDGGFDAWKNAKKPIERVVYEPSTKDHVEELVKLNSFIIDIREVNEFKDVGIVGGSVLAPLSNFNKHEKDGVVDKTKNVYVLCKSGGRACIAYTYLKKLKYTNKMIVLQGGCNKLQETGFVFTPYDG
jgi:rhodanese-related sulfurtransferase